MIEIWKDVVGYEGLYAVSSMGRVKSLDRVHPSGRKMHSRVLKPLLLRHGYHSVSIYLNGIRNHATVHRLVALAFIQNVGNKVCVNHKNGVKTDNRLENLEWSDHSENLIHAYQTGLNNNKGVNSTSSKFTKSDLKEIRRLLSEGNVLQKDIAKKYGVSKSVITDIKQGKSYRN